MTPLAGRRVLITGAAGGIGAATTRALRARGAAALALGNGYVALAGAVASAVLSSAAGPIENILIARYTPSRYHGLGFGAKFVVAFGAGPLAILLIAWVRETTGSLEILFLGLAATSVVITLVALLLRQSPNDVFFQVSLITLVGLAGKNGILIVEFAKQRYEEGLDAMDAALEAAKARLRPIVMTSLAFILGVLPLVRASGAGAATQHSVGTGIMGSRMCANLVKAGHAVLAFDAHEAARASRLCPPDRGRGKSRPCRSDAHDCNSRKSYGLAG